VESFLFAEWSRGALQGMTPDAAFFVRVDLSTMTEADLESGRTIILVGAAPLRPAEFTIFRVAIGRDASPRFIRGDANGDGVLDISDPLRILGYLFLGDPEPPCLDAADSSDEGELSISSALRVLFFLFQGGASPPAPFPACGADPTPDALGCQFTC
jgi:hypothetical protein